MNLLKNRMALLLFILFTLSILLFITGSRLSTAFFIPYKPQTIILIDVSRSISSRTANLKLRGYKTYYFGGNFSDKTNDIQLEETSVFDSVKSIRNRYPGSPIIVFSDFMDNASFSKPEKDPLVYPVLMEAINQPGFGILRFNLPEKIPAGKPVEMTLQTFSYSGGSYNMFFYSDGKKIFSKSIQIKQGFSQTKISLPPQTEGYHTIRAELSNLKLRTYTEKLAFFTGSSYKILFIAGKPSEETVMLKSFLNQLNWLNLETHILNRNKYKLPDLSKISGLLLLDVNDNQLSGAGKILPAVSNGLHVFYMPGISESFTFKKTLDIFTNAVWMESFKTGTYSFRGLELPVSSILETGSYILQLNRIRLFFGWDTWKWKMNPEIDSANPNPYSTFWKNNIEFLISDNVNVLFFEKLNFFTGEPTPIGVLPVGSYQVQQKNYTYPILVTENPAENPVIGVEKHFAFSFGNQPIIFQNNKQIQNWINNLKKQNWNWKKITFSLNSKTNLIFMSGILLVLFTFWLIFDLKKIRS